VEWKWWIQLQIYLNAAPPFLASTANTFY